MGMMSGAMAANPLAAQAAMMQAIMQAGLRQGLDMNNPMIIQMMVQQMQQAMGVPQVLPQMQKMMSMYPGVSLFRIYIWEGPPKTVRFLVVLFQSDFTVNKNVAKFSHLSGYKKNN